MKTPQLLNYERDRGSLATAILPRFRARSTARRWRRPARAGSISAAMLNHAREVGGPALRKLTFHERARMIKALGQAIMARKEELYELNYLTGATRKDGWIDIEGGAGTLFSFSSKGRRELPDAPRAARRRARDAVEERHLHRPAYLHLAAGRGGPHQRLQLPGLGDAREARADPARGRSGDREAGQLDRLSVRSGVPGHDRQRTCCRRARSS